MPWGHLASSFASRMIRGRDTGLSPTGTCKKNWSTKEASISPTWTSFSMTSKSGLVPEARSDAHRCCNHHPGFVLLLRPSRFSLDIKGVIKEHHRRLPAGDAGRGIPCCHGRYPISVMEGRLLSPPPPRGRLSQNRVGPSRRRPLRSERASVEEAST